MKCNHYDELNKKCSFYSGCRYPEPRFECPLKNKEGDKK